MLKHLKLQSVPDIRQTPAFPGPQRLPFWHMRTNRLLVTYRPMQELSRRLSNIMLHIYWHIAPIRAPGPWYENLFHEVRRLVLTNQKHHGNWRSITRR